MNDEYPTIGRMRRLEQKAVKLGWNVPAEEKPLIVAKQVEIAKGETGASDREMTSAAKCLSDMNKQDIAIAMSPNLNQDEQRLEPVEPAIVLRLMAETIPTEPDE